jgi:HEAT repeat protein
MNRDDIDRIEIKLRAPRLDRRKAALDELAELPSEIAIPILQKLANEKDFGLRRLAVMGLGNHRSKDSFQALQTILDRERDANVLAEAANSIFEFGDRAIPILQNLFEQSDNWLVRQTVISLLVETDCHEVLLAIATESLKDEMQTVKETGILALGQLLSSPLKDRAIALLTELARDSEWRNRWRTAIALQGNRDPQVKQLIAELQQDEHFRVVAAALEDNSK